MHKNIIKRFFRIFPLISYLLFSPSLNAKDIVHASTSNIVSNRTKAINQDLNQFANFNKCAEPISWNSLCYSQNTDTAEYPERNYLINEMMDEQERQIHNQNLKQNQKEKPVYFKKKFNRSEFLRKNMTLQDNTEEVDSIKLKKKGKEVEGKKYWDKYSFKFSVSVGQRIDKLRWDIAGNSDGTSPNVLSELTWSDLKMRQIKSTAKLIFDNKFILDGMVASADIYEGDNQDSDYLADNRSNEFSRSNNRADDGNALDYSIGMGYHLNFEDIEYLEVTDIEINLLAGYSYHEQNLIITDGNQTLDPYGMIGFLGPFQGLHANYENEWKGPWLGVEFSGKLNKITGLFRFEYHKADYYAWANWNLRTDFEHPLSFEHAAEGNGVTFNLGLDYEVTKNFSIDLKADIQNWSTDTGIDTIHHSSGIISETMLNRVDWRSYALMLGSTYHFN